MEKNILLTIEYDGSNYCGWQRQKDKKTIQGTIEKAISRVLDIGDSTLVNIKGTSRTDAGVHAFSQKAVFLINKPIPTENIKRALNDRLPRDIRIVDVLEVPLNFHPRFSCKSKTYRYKILNYSGENAFSTRYMYQVKGEMDISAMKEAASYIVGTHDFKSFESSGGTIRESTVRTIFSININEIGDSIEVDIAGDGFLYNMVRIIIGTLVEVSLGKISSEDIMDIISKKDRSFAGHTAPPGGLYLLRVEF